MDIYQKIYKLEVSSNPETKDFILDEDVSTCWTSSSQLPHKISVKFITGVYLNKINLTFFKGFSPKKGIISFHNKEVCEKKIDIREGDVSEIEVMFLCDYFEICVDEVDNFDNILCVSYLKLD